MADVVPGAFDVPAASPLYVDGVPVDALVDALKKSQDILAAQKQVADTSFWSTPRRTVSDATREVFEVNLNAARMVNTVAFDLARFPHTAWLYYRDPKTKAWKPMLTTSGAACKVAINDSLPATIQPLPPGSTSHPQHYGAGHWVHYEQTVRPVTASQFRMVLVRQPKGRPPLNTVGKPTPYSLGIRGFNIGYKVRGYKDVPRTPRDPIIVTERESFTSTTDILGSPVTLSIRENRASDLLNGAQWKCEPQPIPQAVVNLYVDARDDQGQPQVVDRFYLDPITSGVHMNLYYSNDTPSQTTFEASDHPLTFPASQAVGSGPGITPDGLLFPDAVGYVDIDNSAVQFNPDRPFWLALSLQPIFDSTSTDRHVLFDTGIVRVEWTGRGTLQATVGSAILADPNVTFNSNDTLNVVVGWDGQSAMLYSSGSVATVDLHGSTPKSSVNGWNIQSGFRIGGLLVPADGDPGHGNFRLKGLVLKSEPPPSTDTFDAFFADIPGYLVKSDFPEDDTHTTDNALLRYLPAFQTYTVGTINPLGLVGGPSDRYSELVWTPVARDFTLNKGYAVFPPTPAKYFKFEFTNLAAMPYDNFYPTTRVVQVFPTAVYHPATPKPTASNNTAGGGVPAAMSASVGQFFADQSRLLLKDTPSTQTAAYTATEAVYSTNPTTQAALRSNSLYFSLQPWHPTTATPRFVEVQKHVYDKIEVQHNTRVAYFVGLASLSMARVDYLVDDDADQYLETFDDTRHIDVASSGWNLLDGYIETPDNLLPTETITAQSQVFSSRRKVIGLQFATQQTPPIQLLEDPDFDDTSLTYWRPYGDGQVTPSEDFTTDIGTMVKVQRDSTTNFWGNLEDRYPTWNDIESVGLTWGDLEISNSAIPFGGVEAVGGYDFSPQGRLYAAARVYAPKALTAPLFLQLVSDAGDVLSSEPIEVQAGQVTEWYASYTIGEGGDVSATTWGQIEGQALTWGGLESQGSWGQIENTVDLFSGKVSVRLFQDTPTTDSWYIDNISLFDDPITWQFSNDGGASWYNVYDIRNDPNGVFMFPPSSSPQAGVGLRWRCVGSYSKIRVSDLAIRPWYDSLPMGQPHRETIQTSGPNQALIDHYGPVEDDPRWKTWHKPIPESWWFTFRQWLLAERPDVEAKSYIVAPDAIVPVQENYPPPVTFHEQNGVVLMSGITRSSNGKNTPVYPWGPTATAVLDDGTIFVAVNVDPQDGSSLGFIRMWKLAPDLTVLGTVDHVLEDPLTQNGDPVPFALSAEGNKVVLLVLNSFDKPGSFFSNTMETLVDDGTQIAAPPVAGATLVGTAPYLNAYAYNPSTYVQIDAANSNVRAVGGHPVQSNGHPWTTASDVIVTKIYINAQVNVPLTDVTWELIDTRKPYASRVLLSGAFTGSSTQTAPWIQAYINGGLTISDPTMQQTLGEAFYAGALVVMAVHKTTSGINRRTSYLTSNIYVDRLGGA